MWQTLWALATSNAQLAARSVWHVRRQWGNNNLRGRNVTVAMAPTRKRTSKLFWYQHVHRYMKEESSETSTIAVGDLLKILSLISTGKGAFSQTFSLAVHDLAAWWGCLLVESHEGASFTAEMSRRAHTTAVPWCTMGSRTGATRVAATVAAATRTGLKKRSAMDCWMLAMAGESCRISR